jgi:general secretion pathway protein I
MTSERYAGHRGFTLLEVLVALAIVGLGMMAIFTQLNQSLLATDRLREKTIAGWIALDRITELKVTRQFPRAGEQTDELEMVGQEWKYTVKTTQTPIENIRRIDVTVSRGEKPDVILSKMTGFLGKPSAERSQTVVSDWPITDETLSDTNESSGDGTNKVETK